MPRDVPGIDNAYLAMDTEEGVEVVWNEVIYSQTRKGPHKERKVWVYINHRGSVSYRLS